MTNADGDFGLRGKGRTAENRNRFPTVSIRARREYRRDCHPTARKWQGVALFGFCRNVHGANGVVIFFGKKGFTP